MSSFVKRFSKYKKETSDNSLQQEIILSDVKEAEEALAEQRSLENSSTDNTDNVHYVGQSNIVPDWEKQDFFSTLFEQATEKKSLESLLVGIEQSLSPESLDLLLQYYKNMLQDWRQNMAHLRNKNHLKEYLSILSALSMLEHVMQRPDPSILGRQFAQSVRHAINVQQTIIEQQVDKIQSQIHKSHESNQQLNSSLLTAELLLKVMAERWQQSTVNASQHVVNINSNLSSTQWTQTQHKTESLRLESSILARNNTITSGQSPVIQDKKGLIIGEAIPGRSAPLENLQSTMNAKISPLPLTKMEAKKIDPTPTMFHQEAAPIRSLKANPEIENNFTNKVVEINAKWSSKNEPTHVMPAPLAIDNKRDSSLLSKQENNVLRTAEHKNNNLHQSFSLNESKKPAVKESHTHSSHSPSDKPCPGCSRCGSKATEITRSAQMVQSK
jgi:hypothetical protein